MRLGIRALTTTAPLVVRCHGQGAAATAAVVSLLTGLGIDLSSIDLPGGAVAHLRVDRIAEPWGTRTPFAAAGDWPQRVDQFLADGLTGEMVDRWVQSASVLHSNGDAMDIAVRDGVIVGVRCPGTG